MSQSTKSSIEVRIFLVDEKGKIRHVFGGEEQEGLRDPLIVRLLIDHPDYSGRLFDGHAYVWRPNLDPIVIDPVDYYELAEHIKATEILRDNHRDVVFVTLDVESNLSSTRIQFHHRSRMQQRRPPDLLG